MKTSTNTIIFHEDQTISYRIDGRWFKNRQQIPAEDILKFTRDLRAKVWTTGYFLGYCLVKDVPQVGNFEWPYGRGGSNHAGSSAGDPTYPTYSSSSEAAE